VARNLSERTARGAPGCSLSTGPYCKARRRLRLELVEALLHAVAWRLEAAQPQTWRWQWRSVKLLDGTTVSMPDTPNNQRQFPQNRTQQPGLGFPLARVVAILTLGTGAVLDDRPLPRPRHGRAGAGQTRSYCRSPAAPPGAVFAPWPSCQGAWVP